MNNLEHLVVHGCINISIGFFLLSLNWDPILQGSGSQITSAEHLCFASWIEVFRHWNRELTVFSQSEKEE